MMVTLHRSDRGLTFDEQHEVVALLMVPDGCEVLLPSLCVNEHLLAVPVDGTLRCAWQARDVLRAAVDGDERFTVLDVYAESVRTSLSVERN